MVSSVLEGPAPAGWTSEWLPHCAVRLRPTELLRPVQVFLAVVGFAAVCWLASGWLSTPAFHHPGRLDNPLNYGVVRWTMLLLSGFGMVGLLLWSVFGKEEWTVGADRLEIRRTLLRWTWERRFAAGTLYVEARWHRGRRTMYLVLHGRGGRQVLAAEGIGGGNVRELGRYLSRITGWPLQNEAGGLW